MNTIPLLPNRIAIGLHDDLIQFLIETKFLLLFCDNPWLVFHTDFGAYLNPRIVEAVRQGHESEEVTEVRKHLRHLDAVKSPEWDEIIRLSSPSYMQFEESVPDQDCTNDVADRQRRVEEVLTSVGASKPGAYEKLFSPNPENEGIADIPLLEKKGMSKKTLTFLRVLHTKFFLLVSILDTCAQENIPMVWTQEHNLSICEIYTKHLANKLGEDFADDDAATLRRLHGDALMREILNLEIVNVATVPIDRLLEFKQRYRDLLDNFLTYYRGFLASVQSKPEDVRSLTQEYGQNIVVSLREIQNEVLLLKKQQDYKWLDRISNAAFESANKGLITAAWDCLMNPLAFLVSNLPGLAKFAAKGATAAAKDLQAQRQLLVRSNSGYLWRAREEFGWKESP
jgi:hypothetical protein